MVSFARTRLLVATAALGILLGAAITSRPAQAASSLSGHWVCDSYGISVNWFQDIVFYPNGRYALGYPGKTFSPGTYSMAGSGVITFHSGGNSDFLGLYKPGSRYHSIYLKGKKDRGPFEKRGYGTITFRCDRSSH